MIKSSPKVNPKPRFGPILDSSVRVKGAMQLLSERYRSIFGVKPFLLYSLAFTRYCHYQYCMVYGTQRGGRWGGRILRNGRALVLQ